MWSQYSSGCSSAGLRSTVPALFTRMSIGGHSRSTRLDESVDRLRGRPDRTHTRGTWRPSAATSRLDLAPGRQRGAGGHDIGARFGERDRHRPADAAPRAGDQRGLAVEPKAVENHAGSHSVATTSDTIPACPNPGCRTSIRSATRSCPRSPPPSRSAPSSTSSRSAARSRGAPPCMRFSRPSSSRWPSSACPPTWSSGAVADGLVFGWFRIAWMVVAAVFVYEVCVESGKFEIVKQSVGGISNDRRLQVLLIAFAFGALLEGAGGGGAPVAITGAMMIGLGFPPFQTAVMCLIANSAPVAYGGLGQSRAHAGRRHRTARRRTSARCSAAFSRSRR